MELTGNVCNQIDSTSLCQITSITGCSKTEIIRIYDFIKNHNVKSSSEIISSTTSHYSHNSSVKNLATILSQKSNTSENYLLGGKSLEIFQKSEILQRYTVYQVLNQIIHKCNQSRNMNPPLEYGKSNVNQEPELPIIYTDVPSSIISDNLPLFPQSRREKSLDSSNASRSSSRGSARVNKGCSFCRTNNEAFAVYTSHLLFDKETNILQCPVLRKLVCPLCGSTGDNAHTLSYCPLNSSKLGPKPVSVFKHINSSSRFASGKIRP